MTLYPFTGATNFGTNRAICINEPSGTKIQEICDLEEVKMAIQKKSLISGKSTPKKATTAMPRVSENPGMTKVAHTRVAHTRLAVTKVAATRVAATKVAATRIAATRVAANRVAVK
jgi:hypothetical protein